MNLPYPGLFLLLRFLCAVSNKVFAEMQLLIIHILQRLFVRGNW